MAFITLRENDQIMMSLVHYFVTQENYTPINVQGVKDEIWLENIDGLYRVIRINSNAIINDEQYKFDIFKMKHILKQIKKKTLSFKVKALNIDLDLSKRVDYKNDNYINTVRINTLDDVKENKDLIKAFPALKDTVFNTGDSLDLIINVTNDINEKTEKDNRHFSKIFSPKRMVFTPLLIVVCFGIFLATYFFGDGSTNAATLLKFGANYLPLVKAGQIWRLLTCAFLHIGLIHLLVNMYSLFVIGSQVETFMGKWKFLVIYFISAISGSLLSLAWTSGGISAGASGAIFGLMGSLLYFGYHYRLYLSDALRRQIIPLIILNLMMGLITPGIDNAAHIGGLIGGYLVTMAIGVEGKSKAKDMLNGWIVLILYIAFLAYTIFFLK